jgi:large subunit ribosomal protein L13
MIIPKGEQMKTYTPKLEEVRKDWYLIDVKGKILGRVATQVAKLLMGKGKPEFCKHLDLGDYVIVINSDQVRLSGKKENQKEYFHHTGYPEGSRKISFSKYIKTKPEELFREAVKGMLPHNPLGRKMLSKLHVYRGENHPHQAQKPVEIKL